MRRTRILRLYPNRSQERHLATSLYLTRKLYNACLEQRIHHYNARGRAPGAYDQTRELPKIKAELPEFREPAANVLQFVCRRLDDAFQRFFRGQNKFPRFKGSSRWNSLVYPHATNDFRIEDDRFLRVTKLGRVRYRGGHPAWLDGATQKRLIVKRVAGEWYAHITYEIRDGWKRETVPSKGTSVGVDLGIRTLATLSDGTLFENPKNVIRAERQLRRMYRSLSRMKRGSNNRRKHIRLIQRQHVRVTNRRRNHAHNVTRRIADKYERVVLEDIKPRGLFGNGYGKYQSDAAWGQLCRLLTYKVRERGGTLVLVNPAGTSQECNRCGQNLRLRITDRNKLCPGCGRLIRRDVNAAQNILDRGLDDVPVRGGEPKPVDTGGRKNGKTVLVPVDEARTETVA